jgi:chloride channel 3/4/5
VQFQITYHHQWSYFEILPFATLGALGGNFHPLTLFRPPLPLSLLSLWALSFPFPFASGLLGAQLISGAVKVSTFRRAHPWLRTHPITEVLVMAFITSLLGYSNIYVRYSATDLLERLFGDCSEYELGANNDILTGLCSQESVGANVALLTVAGILKLVLTIATYGSMVCMHPCVCHRNTIVSVVVSWS